MTGGIVVCIIGSGITGMLVGLKGFDRIDKKQSAGFTAVSASVSWMLTFKVVPR